MKNKNILSIAILAAVGVALCATSAQAAPLTYSTGNLLLGVRQGSVGATTDFVLNLGSYTQFLGGPTNLSFGSIGSDLTALYGASWNTRSDLFWSVGGYENTTKSNTLYITAPESPLGTSPGSPASIASGSTQALAANKFLASGNAYANALDSASGSGGAASNSAGLRQLTSDTSSWASFNGGTQTFSGNAWSYFTPATEGNFGSGTANSVLDLYQIIRNGLPATAPAAGAINNLGYFAIDDGGALSFNSPSPSPVPEPTGIAVGILAGLSGLVARRRQRTTVA